MDRFQDIRPYNDDEVRPVIDALLANSEFISSIASFAVPKLYKNLPFLARFLTKRKLTQQLQNVNDVSAMQGVIALYMDQMIEKTASQLTHSGLDNLDKNKNYLFVSNHRDIAMDPAFVNYVLYHAGFSTLFIAIGDNLLKRPFVTDLMRLNKSFIVKRSLKGRDLLKSSKQLSEYIHHMVGSKDSVWIAQREGRAKDGVDRTDTALLKMLTLAKRSEGFKEALSALHIVPVSISYEFDPCDSLKADELYQKAELGTYNKDEQSDINSIVTGMVGAKGHVHVSFGKEITLQSDDVDEAALCIDQQIIENYLLQPSNFLALQALQLKESSTSVEFCADHVEMPSIDAQTVAQFEERVAKVDPKILPYWLKMYANPVLSFSALQNKPN